MGSIRVRVWVGVRVRVRVGVRVGGLILLTIICTFGLFIFL